MLLITLPGRELLWYVGDVKPHLTTSEVMSVTANADELVYVENRFINLRQVKGAGVTSWLDDDARFIVANLG